MKKQDELVNWKKSNKIIRQLIYYLDISDYEVKIKVGKNVKEDQGLEKQTPVKNNDIILKNRKTLCMQYFGNGDCVKDCKYSHDGQQLFEMITENMEKGLTQICKFHFAKKNCRSGEKCKHSHEVEDLAQFINSTNQLLSEPSPPLEIQQQQTWNNQQLLQKYQYPNQPNQQAFKQEGQTKVKISKNNQTEQICWYHFANKCDRPNCKYSHDKNKLFTLIQESKNEGLPKICKFHFAKQNCTAKDCKRSHNDTEFSKFVLQINQIISQSPSPQLLQQNPAQTQQQPIQQLQQIRMKQ